jgi:hypothetical protein
LAGVITADKELSKPFQERRHMHIQLTHKGHVLSPNRKHLHNLCNIYEYVKQNGNVAEIPTFYGAWVDTIGIALSRLLAKEFVSESVYIQPLDYFLGGGGIRYQLAKVPCGPGPCGTAEIGLPIRTTVCVVLNVGIDSKHNGRKSYSVLAKGCCEQNRIGKEFPSEWLNAWREFGEMLVKPIDGWRLSVLGKYPVLSATPDPIHRQYKGGRW